MSLQIGENVGPYRIIAQLGQGGMATVYKAYHANLDRYVAIKVLHPAFKEDSTFLGRFQREARVLAKLEHPNIVPIYDFADHAGQPYLVMKYVEGETLKGRLTGGPVPLAETLKVVDAVGSALAYAHKQGILHRDIKPSNVIITADGQYFLSDFGLARIATAGESTLSQDTMLGTPNYISPEQAKGVRELDGRTDIYSFGVMLYEIIVGRVPYSGDTPFAVIHDHIYTPLPPPTQMNPGVSEAIEMFLLKALAKEREDRFADAAAMVAAFHQAAAEQLPAPSGSVTAALPRPTPQATLADKRVASATAKAPPAAPTIHAKAEFGEATVAEKPKSGKLNWLWIAGAIVLVLCLCLFGLVIVTQPRRNATATAVAAMTQAAQVTLAPELTATFPLPPPGGETPPRTHPPPNNLPPGGNPPPPCNPQTDAIAQGQSAVAANPESMDAHSDLADAFFRSGCLDESLNEYMRAAKLAKYAPVFYEQLVLPNVTSDPIFALTVLADGLRHQPDRRLWEMAGPIMDQVAQSPQGEQILIKLAHDFPDNPAPSAMLARHYIIQGQPEKAGPVVDSLLQRFPEDIATRFVYADYLASTGDKEGAIREFEALLANPDTPPFVRRVAERRINELKGNPSP